MTGITQVRIAKPSICISTASQTPMPQPNLLPVRLRCSRTTHSSGTSSGPLNSAGIPLTENFTDMASSLSRVGSERIVRERHHVEPPAGRAEQGLRQRGSHRREYHFAEPLRGTIAGKHDRDDLRHLVDAQQRIVEEVALLGTAVRERDPALERVGERKSDPALDLRLERVWVDHEAGIDRAEHALDRQPPAD